jgi:periplasmic protein CpxP/Spy
MTDQTTPAPRRGFGLVSLIVAAALGLAAGGFATAAVGSGMGGHGWGHHGMRGPMTEAQMQEHAVEIVDHIGWAIDATDEQKAKLTTIATAMLKDLEPAHAKLRAAHDRIAELLRQPKTDRAALEALRAEHIALADDVSKRITQGLADASDVLTPQQRAKLADHFRF